MQAAAASLSPRLACGVCLRARPATRSRAARAQPARAVQSGGSQPAALKRWPEEVAPPGADTATPQVPLPPVKPTKKLPTFGFVDNAETINSRAAMIGFFALLALEAVAGKGILELVGIETGNGIDIGF